MLKKTIPYIDLNGVERKEDFYFHLSKPEIVKMQTSVKGGYDVQLKSIGAGAARLWSSLRTLLRRLTVSRVRMAVAL